MLVDFKPASLFVASDAEFAEIRNLQDIFDLIMRYEGTDCYGGFEMLFAVSRVCFEDETHIPEEISKAVSGDSKTFQYDRIFINKIASFEKEEMDSFAYLLREDKFCQSHNLDGMGLRCFLYELHNCCSLAGKKNLNLYVIEHLDELIAKN